MECKIAVLSGNRGMEKLLKVTFWEAAGAKRWFAGLWNFGLPLLVLTVLVLKLESSGEVIQMKFLRWERGYLLMLAVALLPINILIESRKWGRMVEHSGLKTNINPIKTVLAGKSLNMISPFGLGDGFARFSPFYKKHNTEGVALILLDRITKTIPTYVLGLVSAAFLIWSGLSWSISWYHWIIAAGLILMALLAFRVWVRKKSGLLQEKVRLLKFIKPSRILEYTVLSILRYLVFTLQFVLVLLYLNYDVSLGTMILGVSWIFFAKSVLPGLSIFGDLAVRELSAYTFFQTIGAPTEPIIVGTFIIWFVNILIPALAGVFFITDTKKHLS